MKLGRECTGLQKLRIYGHWKEGQVTQENYRDTVCHCREKISVTLARLELKLASTVNNKKKGFLNYVNSKRKIEDNIDPLLDEVENLTDKVTDKAEAFNALVTSVFNTNDGPWDPWRPVLNSVTGGMKDSQWTLSLFKTCCSSSMHINLCVLMGSIPGYWKNWLMLL